MSTESKVDEAPNQRHWQRVLLGPHPRRALIRILFLVLTVFLLVEFVLQPIRVTGSSMVPTYRDGGINFVNLLAYRKHPPQRGDVVSIKITPKLLYLKRVVGLPGETVAMNHGVVTIDGKQLEEPYVKLKGFRSFWPVRLAEDEYFLVGDNRSVSEMGSAKATNILGKVLY
jgi:signal peptidase I